MEKRLVDVKELAVYMQVKANTLYSWVSQKQIPYKKVGRLVRFDVQEIDRWLNEKNVEVYKYR